MAILFGYKYIKRGMTLYKKNFNHAKLARCVMYFSTYSPFGKLFRLHCENSR